jgi:O-acetyl-ADP-ribose deacetylase (regulator of RNase III)
LGWPSIINAYTQYDYGYDGKDRFQYQALRRVLLEFSIKLAVTQQKYNGPIRVGFPKIGAGLAGGNWTRILEELERFDRRTAKYCQTTLVLYE